MVIQKNLEDIVLNMHRQGARNECVLKNLLTFGDSRSKCKDMF